MSQIHIQLFGRFRVHCDAQIAVDFSGQKARELFCYLLIHRERPHLRQKLACLLWPESGARANQYLRRTLWQLQATLVCAHGTLEQFLAVESDWVQLNPASGYWSDVGQFEAAFSQSERMAGHELDAAQAKILAEAVELYRGDLLEDWYQDWCILERHRFQNMYVGLLDKLMIYCEVQEEFERGIGFGSRILRLDPARERTYRRLMRLRYLAGDRTGAIREYERCVSALEQEFGVTPAEQTMGIHEKILAGQFQPPASHLPLKSMYPAVGDSLDEILGRLDTIRAALILFQREVEGDIATVKALATKPH